MAQEQITTQKREGINSRFRMAVNYLLQNGLAHNKNEIMSSLGLYLGRLSLILADKANASTDNLANLAQVYGVSTEYLLLGTGPIMSDGTGRMPLTTVAGADNILDNVSVDEFLPLIPNTALAGFNGIDEPGVKLEECARYYVPEFSRAGATFLIRVHGNSMTPTFCSGDLVACRKLEADAWLEYGDTYIIDGQQGAMLKRIYSNPEDPDSIICKSDNAENAPFTIRKSEIRSLSKVIGAVRNV